MYVMQCVRCGDVARRVRKASLPAAKLDTLPRFDERLQQAWIAQRQQRARELQEAQDGAWWDRYQAYLQTPQWEARRQRVFARARGTCEGCGVQMATQVHHLTYRRVTQEMLFDLVAVCDTCHEQVHEAKP